MNRDVVIKKALDTFCEEMNFHGDISLLIINDERHPRFFKKGFYIITIKLNAEENCIIKSYTFYDEKRFIETSQFRFFIFVYSLISLLYLVGIYNNSFISLTYFSPILLGFWYFKLTYNRLGELLKKQADTVSFFLGMLTACYLQVKLLGFNVNIFPSLNYDVTIFFVSVSLHMFCMFISIKFFISASDLLKSTSPHKNIILQWINRLLF